MNRSNLDVAVIGLGPVGGLAALLLARDPRVGVLDGEAMRTPQKAGVYERATVGLLRSSGPLRVKSAFSMTMPTLDVASSAGATTQENHCRLAAGALQRL